MKSIIGFLFISIQTLFLFLIKNNSPLEGKSENTTVSWTYYGKTGPFHWGDLHPSFSKCKDGKEQSPRNLEDIDLTETSLELNWVHRKISNCTVRNNGHTIQFQLPQLQELQSLIWKGDSYFLEQFHIHTPSEHWVHGEYGDMEIHFFHRSRDEKVAVFGLMYRASTHSIEQRRFFRQFLNKLKADVNHEGFLATIDLQLLRIGSLLEVYSYNGSMTTPPCTEGVQWFIYKEILHVGVEQLEKIRQETKFNARPIQS